MSWGSFRRIAGWSRSSTPAVLCAGLSLAVVAGVPATSNAQGRAAPWAIVPSRNEEGANWLQAVDATAGDSAWSVGYYIGSEGVYETLAERWDGSAWTLVETPNVGTHGDWLNGVAAVSSSEAWAVGYTAGDPSTYTSTTVVEHWTGSAWSVVASPNPSKDPIYGANQLFDVRAFAPNDVWAAGWQWTPAGSAPLVERWDGRSWKVSPTPDTGTTELQALDGTSSNDIWAVGQSVSTSDGHQSFLIHWDGGSWSVVSTPKLPFDNYLNDIAAISPTDVWAAGYSNTRSQDIQPHYLHWDGSAWTRVPSPHLSSSYNFVQALGADSASDVWAAGNRAVNGRVVTLVEHWDGSRWHIDPTPSRPGGGNYLYGLSVDPGGGLWAAGYFYPNTSSRFRTLILRRSNA